MQHSLSEGEPFENRPGGRDEWKHYCRSFISTDGSALFVRLENHSALEIMTIVLSFKNQERLTQNLPYTSRSSHTLK